MKTTHDLGEELNRARKKQRLTQEQVAAMTGLRQEALSRFERGRASDFSLAKLLRVAHALGYDLQLTPLNKRPTLTDVLEEIRVSANTGPNAR